MSTTGSKLKLDEQSFQGLLAAAFTIQEHNAKRKRTAADVSQVSAETEPSVSRCPRCTSPLKDEDSICEHCGYDPVRPGERMQRKYASLWEMSQEQGVRRDPAKREESEAKALPPAPETPAEVPAVENREEIRILDVPENSRALEVSPSPERSHTEKEEADWYTRLNALTEVPETADSEGESTTAETDSATSGLSRLRQQARTLPRADLYLGLAIVVAILAIIWPTPSAPQRGQLQPWQRMLIAMGIAEAPPAQVHYRGNPNVQVWVDPHTALYYCAGQEQYGKTTDGRFVAQREAQMEQFEPAGRSTCQ